MHRTAACLSIADPKVLRVTPWGESLLDGSPSTAEMRFVATRAHRPTSEAIVQSAEGFLNPMHKLNLPHLTYTTEELGLGLCGSVKRPSSARLLLFEQP